MTGTIDGVSLDAYYHYPQISDLSDAPGAIFNNWFRVVDLARGCARPQTGYRRAHAVAARVGGAALPADQLFETDGDVFDPAQAPFLV